MDAQQNMAARYMYGAFGRVTGKWGPMADANIMQFSSMPVHRQSGLSLYPVRAYDPTLQRWLIQDPIGEAGGINLYGFVGNNSINRRDPFGLDYHAVNMMPGNVGGYPLYYGDTLGEDVAVFSQNVGAAAVNIVGGAIGGTEHLIDSTFGSGTTEAAGIYFGMNAGALPELAGALEAVSQKIGSLLSKCTAAKPPANVGKIADDVLEWLGQNSSMSKPPGGSDLVLRSADGTKQIRFDLTNPHGLDPHVNVETFEPRDLFPGDRKMTQTGNDHVFPKP
jgi:RHS repeat-associated protein